MTSNAGRRNIEAIYPLSPMQEGMLFHSLYAPDSGVYVEQLGCTLLGDLDVPAFERAWQRVVDRHSILRTSFLWKRLDRTLQVVQRQVRLSVAQEDWRGVSPAEQEARLEDFLQADRRRGFDLARPPLIRLTLLRTADEAFRFVWSHHHAIMDGWSLPLLLKEVLACYEAFHQGRDLYLPPPRPYREYIAWLQRQDAAQAEAYWRGALQGITAPTPLVVDGAYPRQGYAEEKGHLSAEVTAQLLMLARQRRLTLSTLVQGAWALLLGRYSGEEDVVLGATVSGRPPELPGVETMVGLFINTLPVRVHLPAEQPVGEWLEGLQAQLVEMRQYEHIALSQVQGWSAIPRNQPMFESILVFENYPVDGALREQKGSLRVADVRSIEQTNYPLTVVSGPGEELPLTISYDRSRFDAGTVRRMLGHLTTLLEGIAAQPGQRLSALPLLTEVERQHILVDWNATAMDYPQDSCAHALFEAQADQRPEAVALVFEQEQMTYGELERRANQLAHRLQSLGVGPEVLVGICVERSLEMIVSMLGVLKAGGAYLPLDPDYPPERLAYMLQDAQASVLLTQERLLARLPASGARMICLDRDWASIAQESAARPSSAVSSDNLAYVIYTSGSTGRPKGTLLRHRGLANLYASYTQVFRVKPGERVLQFASSSFDASVWDVYMVLFTGATLHLIRRETTMSMPDLHRLMQEQEINHVCLPPAVLRLLPADGLPALRTLISAGEACTPDIVARWAIGRRFFNGYGPTENTVASTWGEVTAESGTATVPIGRPIPNAQCYVLDRFLNPVPVGVPGELHVGGPGLARGYLNRPDLTAERFIAHPFVADPQARLYKTGDLVRYRPDGNMEFVGRVDHQVKMRGFRVELGEIEAVLEEHPSVQMAAVLAREDARGDRQLVAYIAPAEGAACDVADLRNLVRDRLPDYMAPAVYMPLEKMPLTPSGKIDRQALPAPDGAQLEAGRPYVAPSSPLEELVAGVWEQVLGVQRVSADDSFFALGGHSLLATQVISRLRNTLGVEVPLRDLFEAPTLAALAERIGAALQADAGQVPAIVPVSREGELPLSFAQQRLWFLDQLSPGNLFYNIPVAVRLTGDLDVAALEKSLNAIIQRHEALRTLFIAEGGKPQQVIQAGVTLSLGVQDLSHLPAAEREAEVERLARAEAGQPFDLARGPLLRARLFKLAAQEHVIVVTMHHIISDGWSLGVLVRELAALYGAIRAGRPSPLPELPIQYADYAAWQRGWLQGDVLEAQLDYWRKQLAGAPPLLELPTDHPRPAMQTYHGATESFAFPAELLERLRALSRAEGTTLFMTLLAAFQTLLYRYSGQEDICVGTPIANRNRADIEGLIGFFVNTLVMRGDLSGQPGFRDLLKRVRETALGAYAHQDVPFEMLVEQLQPQRNMSHTPLFQVAFSLQNTPAVQRELPGLTLKAMSLESGTAKFDLTLVMAETDEGLAGSVEYNTDLFEAETIRRMVGHLQTLLEGIVAAPDCSVARLPLLTADERRQVLAAWNETTRPFPGERCMHELFEEQAARQPEALALTFEGYTWTYGELDRRANQLARYLRRLGVGPEALVGLCALRGPEMVVGVLGVWKAGGAYLPLDPSYPPERLAYMLADARVPVLLTQEALLAALPVGKAQVVGLDRDWPQIARESEASLPNVALPEGLAYVIYTSGSTGRPKGTLLAHRGLVNLSRAQRDVFSVGPGSRVLQFAPWSFDASVWELVMALGNGATLVLARQEVLASGPELGRLLREEAVTHVTLPPSVLRGLKRDGLEGLRTVVAAGEACPVELARLWSVGRQFVDAYGPTETTVCASLYVCEPEERVAPPIGKALPNFRLYVLDRHGEPVPVGVPGELCVGGVGLARGYLGRPELTAERFMPDPFSGEPGARLYRTGDLVRYRPDGNVEFLGRLDDQVKVRGFRIEMGEVEAALRECAGVRAGVVV
ncbi:MAG: amino acid adenylation domain-containing protein, partial [Chloroflexi bacterium]|nr:amino acid adenylation domain-containing protein [Chloroflexota bacterium]